VLSVFLAHKRKLIGANIVAILAALFSVPVPFLMPLLVDEVLLGKPSALVGAMQSIMPKDGHNLVTN